MTWWIILGLLLVCTFLLRRYLQMRGYMKHLHEALESRQSYLVATETTLPTTRYLAKLTESVNALIIENTELHQARVGHLKQLEATLGNMQEGVMILDDSNRVIHANDALIKTFSTRFESQAIEGQRVEVFFSSSQLLDCITQTRLDRFNEPRELELAHGNTVNWVRVSCAKLKTELSGDTAPILIIFHDITRQKQLEGMRKEFVANVSHELRTPVTIIKGYVDTLFQDFTIMPDEHKVKFINKLRRNVDRMYNLLLDLLSLARLEARETRLEATSLDINHLLRRVVERNQDRFETANMLSKLSLSKERPRIMGDAIKLEQVIENLLDNAMKYIPEQSTIEVGSDVVDNSVLIWVEDNGTGIPEADLPRIFERFYRVDKGRSRDKGGTGLGLSIVKRTIALHEGHVDAENVEGGGFRINMHFPLSSQA